MYTIQLGYTSVSHPLENITRLKFESSVRLKVNISAGRFGEEGAEG